MLRESFVRSLLVVFAVASVAACGSVDPSAFDVPTVVDQPDSGVATVSDAPADGRSEEIGSPAADTGSAKDATHDDTFEASDVALVDSGVDSVVVEDTFVPETIVAVDAPVVDVAPGCDASIVCRRDRDGDGFVGADHVSTCGSCPSGWRVVDPSAKIDCDDDDASVHPGATTFMTTPYCVAGTACAVKSFDYDCDGVEEPEWSTLAGSCVVLGAACAGDGWSTGRPACGASGSWQTCSRLLLLCSAGSSPRTQGCR